jgi:hypothetical protein
VNKTVRLCASEATTKCMSSFKVLPLAFRKHALSTHLQRLQLVGAVFWNKLVQPTVPGTVLQGHSSTCAEAPAHYAAAPPTKVCHTCWHHAEMRIALHGHCWQPSAPIPDAEAYCCASRRHCMLMHMHHTRTHCTSCRKQRLL